MDTNNRTNNPPKRVGTKQSIAQPLIHPFRVGDTYANRQGTYEVMEIAPPTITVRYENGQMMVADIAILARIWDNMQSLPELPEPKPRSQASKPSPQPGVPRRPRSSGGERT